MQPTTTPGRESIVKARFTAILAALALALGIVAVVSAPASAATPHFTVKPLTFAECPFGVACAWTGTNGNGAKLNMPFSIEGTSCHNFSDLGSGWADNIESAENTMGSNRSITFYVWNGCIGASATVNTGWEVNFAPAYANNLLSFRISG